MVTSKDSKDPAISEAPGDLESEHSRQDPKDWVHKQDRGELTELTPVEAFKWSVEGDQSPCMLFYASDILRVMLILFSPRGCGLCVE